MTRTDRPADQADPVGMILSELRALRSAVDALGALIRGQRPAGQAAALATLTYLDAEQLADYINRPSAKAARAWAHRARLPLLYAGAKFQVRRRDVDLALEGRLVRRRKDAKRAE